MDQLFGDITLTVQCALSIPCVLCLFLILVKFFYLALKTDKLGFVVNFVDKFPQKYFIVETMCCWHAFGILWLNEAMTNIKIK
jgi:hypothetical protein